MGTFLCESFHLECETGFEKWIYVLKYMEVLERLPFTAQKKIFDHLAKLADIRCLSSEEQEKYDESINNSSLKFEIMAKQLYVASQRVL